MSTKQTTSKIAALVLAWLVVASGSTTGFARAGELYATQLNAENVFRLQVGGPHSIAGIDDWVISNGVLCAAVSNLGRPGRFSLRGGALVDLGHCGRADDLFVVMHPMLNLDRATSPPFDSIRTLVGDGEARLTVSGEADGLRYERSYVLDERQPSRLRVETIVTRVAAGAQLSTWGELTMHPSGSLRPFSVLLGSPQDSSGFEHPASDGESIASRLAGIVQGDLEVLVGEDTLEPGIAYGVHAVTARREHAAGERTSLPRFSIVSEHFGMSNVLIRVPWIFGSRPVGLLQLAQIYFMNLREVETLRLETRIYVSERADVASITDFVYSDAPQVRGRVDDPNARIHVDTRDGHPLTQVRPDPSGAFRFRAPLGDYILRVRAPGGRSVERALRIDRPEVDAGVLRVGAPARFELPRAGPMRIVFVGIDGTPNPSLNDDLLGLRVGEVEYASAMSTNSISLAGVASDPVTVTLAPGRYRAVATRGPEYELVVAVIDAKAGETRRLPLAAPARAIETPGWIAADLHVHSAASFDTSLAYRERVRSFVAQGGEVIVVSDHDHVFDLSPAIRELGLEASIASVVGVESTSILQSEAAPHTFGHSNVFPMPYRPELFRAGAPTSQGVRLRTMMAEVRALPGERVVQLNHPRGATAGLWDGALFTHLSVVGSGFDPTRPLDAEPNRVLLEPDPISGVRDLDYDLVELMNGAAEQSLDYYKRVRADWFSMLLQGEIRTGTANSDSHRLSKPVGVPRTYVPQANDRPSAFDEQAFVRALREGRVFGTSGPFVEVDLDGAGIGDRFSGRSATLSVKVRAATWAAADRARAYVNGRLVSELALDPGGTARWALEFERDSFVTVEVEGRASDGFEAVLPGAVPFAFTNPVFVDANGDGRWTPPGLTGDLPLSVTAPLPED